MVTYAPRGFPLPSMSALSMGVVLQGRAHPALDEWQVLRAVVIVVEPHARLVRIHDANFDHRFLLNIVIRLLARCAVRVDRLRLKSHMQLSRSHGLG